MSRIIEFFARLPVVIAKVAAIIVGIACVVILVGQLADDAYLVEPIQVPASLATNGYTPEVTARWVVDQMLDIKQQATTRKEDNQPIAPDAEKFDMEVPGSGLTLDTIGQVLRESLGLSEKTISGEIVSKDAGYQLRLRSSAASSYREHRIVDNDVDRLITAAAEMAVQLTAPFTYAAYLHANARTAELEQAIDYCLKNGPQEDRAWALNLRGVMLDERNEWDAATDSYEKALEEDPRFAIAYHNWANILYKQNKFEAALEKYASAVALDSGLRNPSKEAGYYREWGRTLMQPPGPDLVRAAEMLERGEQILDKSGLQQQLSALPRDYYRWAGEFEQDGEFDAAIRMYERARQLDPQGFEWVGEDIDRIRERQALPPEALPPD